MIPRARSSEGGFSLVLSIIILAVLSLLMATTYRTANALVYETVYRQRLAQSYAIAEAGLEDAMHQLYLSSSWTAGYTNKSFGGGSYTVTVVGGASPVVTSTGYSTAIPLIGKAQTTLKVTAKTTATSNVCPNLSASSKLFMSASADAYDSSISTKPVSFGFGSNMCANDRIQIQTNQGYTVNGDVYYGQGLGPDPSTVLGTMNVSTFTRTVPFHDGSAYMSTAVNKNLSMVPLTYYNVGSMQLNIPSGATVTLSAGNYYFKGLTLNTGGTLSASNATAAVVIYLNGDLNLYGYFKSASNVPSKIAIYPQSVCNVNLQSTSPFYGVVEGPGASINDNMVVYGKLAGFSLSIAFPFHYDMQTNNGASAATHISWQLPSWSQNK